MKDFFRKHRFSFHHVLPGLSLVCTLFVFAPVDLFLSSAEEFWFSLGDLARWLGIFALSVFALVTLLAWLLPPKLSVAFRAAVYACSFLAWIQGNLLVLNYGTLDGSLIDWSAYTVQYVLDALLWLVVIGLFVFLMFRYKKKFRRIVEIAACVLIVTQLASLAVFLVRNGENQGGESRYLSHNGEYTVSASENTIVLMPDTVDSVFFQELIQKYPDTANEAFADFTFYRDTVGGAARTKYAVPFILTGDFDLWKGSESYKLDDVAFYKGLTKNGLKASAEKPAFRFIHLKGVHTPIQLDENVKKVGRKNTDESRQCLGVIRILSTYLQQLKDLGVYDRATVIIMADHGSYSHSSVAQSPLFMVKLPGESHPFETSDLPLSYTVFPELLISALRGELTSMEPWKSEGPRYFYKRSEENTTVNLTEYVIDGPVYEAPAVATGVVYHEGTLNNSRDYVPGTTLYFDTRDTARAHFVSGMGNNEGSAVWTTDVDTQMLFNLPEIPGALQLTMEYKTYNGAQTVEVWVNDQLIDTSVADGLTRQSVLIPAGTVTGTELRLRLHLPDAVSPASLGRSGDARLLALNMKSLVISNADQ